MLGSGRLSYTLEAKQFDKAEELGKEVLDERVKVLGDNHPDTLVSMFNLAMI